VEEEFCELRFLGVATFLCENSHVPHRTITEQLRQYREVAPHIKGKRDRKGYLYMSEENKALARRSWELASQHNPDAIEEVYAADLVWHEPDRDIQGLEEAKQFYSKYISAFPDFSFTVEDVIAEGDKVVTRWRARGTHQGEIEDFGPPTGRPFLLEGITIHRIADGKIVEEWERYDNLGLLQQLELAQEE
jgi:steroid delta-isomerase-like uncharacterized protein